jgi:hypothetical protein
MRMSVMKVLATATLIVGLMVPGRVAAQYEVGQKYLGAHIGLSGVGSSAAFGVNGELAYKDRIGIGAWIDTWSYGDSFGTALGGVNWDVRYIALAGTGSYHIAIESSPKWDPFVGLALGYYLVSTTSNITGATYGGDANRIFLGGFGGARYFFKQNLSGVARLGFGASYLTVGVDFSM